MNYRKTKIFLSIMPPWGVQTPPVGISSLASYLKKQDVPVAVCDFNISLYNKYKETKAEFWNPGNKVFWVINEHFSNILNVFSADIDALVKQIIKSNFDFVCFSVFSDNRLFTIEVIKRLRQQNIKSKIIVGGVGCFAENERNAFLKDSVDAFVIGEGEETLLNLIKYYAKDTATPPSFVVSADFPYIEKDSMIDLDDLGFPDFSEFNLNDYTNKALAVSFSRGCVMQCLYCNDRYIMGKYRQKSAKSMVEQIEYYVKTKNIREYAINDLQLNADIKRLKEFCSLLISKRLKIKWTANMMPSDKMTPDVIKALKEAGCKTVIFGVESASANVLSKMNRKFTVETAKDILKNFYQEGIEAWINIIVGYPGETKEDFEETLLFLEDNKQYITKVSVLNKCNIVHNSNLYTQAKEHGILFPADKVYEEVRWASLDGNFETLRDLRLQRTILTLDKLNIGVLQTNVKYADPIASDDQLNNLLGENIFLRDTRNIPVSENNEKDLLVNNYLKSINEILDYKEIQIREIIEHKHQEISQISKDNAKEKNQIAAKFNVKIENLVQEAEAKLKQTVADKDAEIKKLSRDYIAREENLVKENDKKITDLVAKKDLDFEQKFTSFKQDMELNIYQKEVLLADAEKQRAKEVADIVSMKDKEIEEITKQHVAFVQEVVSEKDREINNINNKYQNLIFQREEIIVKLNKSKTQLSDELEIIKNSKWFRLRKLIKKYLFF